jgi:hypothetical protein
MPCLHWLAMIFLKTHSEDFPAEIRDRVYSPIFADGRRLKNLDI